MVDPTFEELAERHPRGVWIMNRLFYPKNRGVILRQSDLREWHIGDYSYGDLIFCEKLNEIISSLRSPLLVFNFTAALESMIIDPHSYIDDNVIEALTHLHDHPSESRVKEYITSVVRARNESSSNSRRPVHVD